MITGKFTFSNEQFNNLFPFFILLDSDLKITKLESALNFIMELNNDVKYNDEIQNTCMFIQVVFVRIASEILEKYLKTNI